MIKLSYTRLLALTCFMVTVVLFGACKKEEDANSGRVELVSFGPTGASHGDTIRFFGRNLNRVTAVHFTGENAIVDKSEFKQQNDELILLIVPDAAERGFVTLKTPDGDVVTKTQFNLGVAANITSLTAQARPGENITITGKFLNWVNSITFANDKVVTTFVSKTINQIVVTVPDDAQTGPLLISYGGTEPMEVETSDTLKVTLPMITGVSPNPVKHNTNLTLTGTDLDLVKQVLFAGASNPVTSFVSQTPTQLVVKVDSATVKGKVSVAAASGVQTQSVADLDVVMPTITGMTPGLIAIGGNLTITGTNLDVVKSVSFVGAPTPNIVSTFVSQSATQLVVTVPANTVTGKVTLNIINTGQTVRSANDLNIVGSSVPPIIIYDDGLTSAWNGWTGGGWGGTKDVDNTSPVRSGTKSVKIDYTAGGYGVPWQLGGANISLSGYTELKVSIYGGTGSNGKSVNVGFNEADGKTITIVEGQWTDFTIPLNQISSVSTLTHLYIKNYSASGAYTIYVDNLGLY